MLQYNALPKTYVKELSSRNVKTELLWPGDCVKFIKIRS
jgi:hypothetical protein